MTSIATIHRLIAASMLIMSMFVASAAAQAPRAAPGLPGNTAMVAAQAPTVSLAAPAVAASTVSALAQKSPEAGSYGQAAGATRLPVPPPDPAPADWGSYTQPSLPPVAPLVFDYTLAAPPVGIMQPDVPRQYRAPVIDAETVWNRDMTFDQAIDLWRPDGLAPVGVTQDATLRNGQFLFSYRFDYQAFDGNFVGSHRVSNSAIAATFPFVPANMNIQRNLLILQYGLTDDFTFFGQLPFQHAPLNYDQAADGDFRTAFTNPGDVTLSTMYVLLRGNRQQVHMNLGMNFPVGFLDSQSDVPSPVLPNLPYAIRTSSGTYDLLPGLTYRGQSDLWTWGAQSIGTVRLGINRLDYKLGDRVDMTTWVARRWGERASTSFRLDSQLWGNVRGADPRLNTALSPTNDPNLQGGNRIDLLFGVNLFFPNTRIPGQRLSIEAGAPVYQSLNGPQLGTSWLLNTGWNLVW